MDGGPAVSLGAVLLAVREVTPVEVTGKGTVLVVSAGTSDRPVCEEAAWTATLAGNEVERLYDVGVAGIHRLLENRGRLDAARVIIVNQRFVDRFWRGQP